MSLNRPILLVLSSDLVSKILLGLVWLLLIRHLPPQELALLTLATSVAVVASQTLGASINRIYILSSPEVNTGDPTPLILFQLCVLFLLGIGGLPFSEVLPGTAYVLTLLLASGILLSDFGKTVYQKQLKFSIFSMIELARSTLVATALVVLVMQLESGVRAWQVLAIQALALWVVSVIVMNRHVRLKQALNLARCTGLLKSAFQAGQGYLFSYFFVLAFFSQVDIFMIKVLSDIDTLASYGSAARYYQLLSLALGAVHTVFLPTMRKLQSREAQEVFFARHFRMLLVFAPAVGIFAVLANYVLPWIDLGRYPEAVPTLQILCLSAIISFAFSPHVNLVFTHHRFRFLFILILIALGTNVALNLVLIPAFGGRGAALATLIASACVTIPIFILSRQLRAGAWPRILPEADSDSESNRNG
jgi:O-antigen/teichoic acid export membrane protein